MHVHLRPTVYRMPYREPPYIHYGGCAEKYLAYPGYEVRRVMNITDVGHLTSDADTGEDKMLRGARREKVGNGDSRFYTDAFTPTAKLGIKSRVVVPATSCIDEFIRVISVLLDKVCVSFGRKRVFDISRLDEYHVFHDFREEDLAVGVRGGQEDKNKRNPADFALWLPNRNLRTRNSNGIAPGGLGIPAGISSAHVSQ